MITIIKHAPHEGLGSFEAACAGHGIDLIDASLAGEGDWERARRASRLIVLGGSMGVYEADRYPFLARELELLRERLPSARPTLGVCLGAQLMAEAAGAKVVRSGRQEIGWFGVTATPQAKGDPVLGGIDWNSPVFHWHGDTHDLPPGAVHLLESQRFAQQGFKLGRCHYGVQFHPEVVEADLPEWLESDDSLPYGKRDGVQSHGEILDGGKKFGRRLEEISLELVRRFLAL